MRYSFLCTTTWFIIFTGLVCADTDVQPIEANSVIEYKDFSYMVISVSDNADKPSQPQGQIEFTWISSRDKNGSDLIHNVNAKSGEMDFNDAGPGIYYVILTVTKYGGGESTSVARKVCIGKEVYELSCKGGTGDDDKSDDKTTPTTPDDNSTSSDDTASLEDCYIQANISEYHRYGKNEDLIELSDVKFHIEAALKNCPEKYSIVLQKQYNASSRVPLTNTYGFERGKYELLIVDEDSNVCCENAKKTIVVGVESTSNDDDDSSDSSNGACYIIAQFGAKQFGEAENYIEWNKTENALEAYFRLNDGCSENYFVGIKQESKFNPKHLESEQYFFPSIGKYYAFIIDSEGNDHSGSAKKTIRIGKLCAEYDGGTVTLSESNAEKLIKVGMCTPLGGAKIVRDTVIVDVFFPEDCNDYTPKYVLDEGGLRLEFNGHHPDKEECGYQFKIPVTDDNISVFTKEIKVKVEKPIIEEPEEPNCNININSSLEDNSSLELSKSFIVEVTPNNSNYDVNLQLSNPSYGVFGDSCFKSELDIGTNNAEISLARINQYNTLTAIVTDNGSQVAKCSVNLSEYRDNSTLMVHSYVKDGSACKQRNYDRIDSNGMPSLTYKIGETIKLDVYADKDKLGTCSDSANISAKIFFDGGPLSLTATNSFGISIDDYYGPQVKQTDNVILPVLLDYSLVSGLDRKYTFEISLRDGNGDYCKYGEGLITKSFVVDVMP